MSADFLVKFWPVIQSVVRGFWEITEPIIEKAAIRYRVPVELYYYSELGLDLFSTEQFQKRDPFSNPQLFEKSFAILNVKGWIEPCGEESYLVTPKARQWARRIIQVGDSQLLPFESLTTVNLQRLEALLRQIILGIEETPKPPEKWAVIHRFRVATQDSPPIVQIREHLMDLFAYRDDSHLTASHPHFGQAGIVWSVMSSLWQEGKVTARHLADAYSFRGYEVNDYEVALEAAAQIGWAEETESLGVFVITPQGRSLREEAERLTDEYFYRPWAALNQSELDELYDLLLKLQEELTFFRRHGKVV